MKKQIFITLLFFLIGWSVNGQKTISNIKKGKARKSNIEISNKGILEIPRKLGR